MLSLHIHDRVRNDVSRANTPICTWRWAAVLPAAQSLRKLVPCCGQVPLHLRASASADRWLSAVNHSTTAASRIGVEI